MSGTKHPYSALTLWLPLYGTLPGLVSPLQPGQLKPGHTMARAVLASCLHCTLT